jgi:hypothetical protein
MAYVEDLIRVARYSRTWRFEHCWGIPIWPQTGDWTTHIPFVDRLGLLLVHLLASSAGIGYRSTRERGHSSELSRLARECFNQQFPSKPAD